MKEMTINELRIVQLDILDTISDFCREKEIKWWIEFGTLLGAVRHNGYIPWDDDIDIGMLRNDYEVLLSSFNEWSVINKESRFELLAPELSKGSCYTFGKIVDNRTELYEGIDTCIKIGVYIDVFVYDNAPKDRSEYSKMLKRRDLLGKLRTIKLLGRTRVSFHTVKLLCAKFLLLPVPIQWITSQIVKNAKKYKDSETGKIADFLWPYLGFRVYLDKDFFEDQVLLSFEGKEYPAPARYDEWLSYNYGDYMIIPPLEQQVQHNIRAFIKDEYIENY